MRPLSAAPVDLLASPDKMMLQFYASGVHEASEVHVQIAGQEVPVRYSGASGYFPGLDEVIVEVPRSLAGMGQVDVALTADGQTPSPVACPHSIIVNRGARPHIGARLRTARNSFVSQGYHRVQISRPPRRPDSEK